MGTKIELSRDLPEEVSQWFHQLDGRGYGLPLILTSLVDGSRKEKCAFQSTPTMTTFERFLHAMSLIKTAARDIWSVYKLIEWA